MSHELVERQVAFARGGVEDIGVKFGFGCRSPAGGLPRRLR